MTRDSAGGLALSRSADVETILSLAAHDLRGPLGVVTGYLRMLTQLPPDALAPEYRQMVAAMHKSTETLTSTVDEIGLLADLAGSALSVNRVDVTVASLLAAFSESGDPTRDLRIDGTAGNVFVRVDPTHMRHALGILLRCTAAALEPGLPLQMHHRCPAGRADRPVILIGAPDAVGTFPSSDDWPPRGSLRPRTVGELVAQWLIETQGARLDSRRRHVVAIELPGLEEPGSDGHAGSG